MAALPAVGRDPERRGAQIVRGVDGRAGADQQARRLQIIKVGGPVEGGGAVPLPHVHVGVPPEELAHPGRVAVPDCLEQLGIGGARAQCRGDGQQRRSTTRGAASSRCACVVPSLSSDSTPVQRKEPGSWPSLPRPQKA